ncbi:MAG TPA: hypothetical protein VFR84_18265 [Candidatus Angelobacter sp.]|nr:hypothetical protein [Candidatus Angelobacter sp.]
MVPEIQLAKRFRMHLWNRHSAATTARVRRLDKATLLLGSDRLNEQQRQQAVLDAFKLSGSLSTFGAVASSQRALEIGTAFRTPTWVNTVEVARLRSGCLELLQSVQQISETFSRI